MCIPIKSRMNGTMRETDMIHVHVAPINTGKSNSSIQTTLFVRVTSRTCVYSKDYALRRDFTTNQASTTVLAVWGCNHDMEILTRVIVVGTAAGNRTDIIIRFDRCAQLEKQRGMSFEMPKGII